jgi:hypothetical protein
MTNLIYNDDRVMFALEALLADAQGWRPLIRNMAARWPDAHPLDIVLAVTSACAAIEANFAAGSSAHEAAHAGYRMASLLAVDFHAMQTLKMAHQSAADLFAYWQIDPFFTAL